MLHCSQNPQKHRGRCEEEEQQGEQEEDEEEEGRGYVFMTHFTCIVEPCFHTDDVSAVTESKPFVRLYTLMLF